MTYIPKRARDLGIKTPSGRFDSNTMELDRAMDEHLESEGLNDTWLNPFSIALRRASIVVPRHIRPTRLLAAAEVMEAIAIAPNSGRFTRTVSSLAGVGLAAVAIDTLAVEEKEREEDTLLKPGDPYGVDEIGAQGCLKPSVTLAGMALFGDAIGLDHRRRALAFAGATISSVFYIFSSAAEAFDQGAQEAARMKSD
ncbi:MAG: hypothetical protein QG623_165 [Patescibacteria group bacterium]|nr:hypothetical protein [Patescibacteria group bacterium]